MSRPVAVVVGGGISGLAAAYDLVRAGVDVRVLEAGARLGGKIETGPFAGVALDAGPDGFLARVPWLTDLCVELGLGEELVAPASRRAYLWSGTDLAPFPEGLVLGVPTDLDALASSGLVSDAGVARAAEDLARPEGTPTDLDDGDESVGSLVRRRVGDEVFTQLVEPLLSGVNAGNADRLSVALGAPQLAAAAASDTSLIRGLQAQRRAASTSPDAPVFWSLPGGVSRIVEALARRLRADGATITTGAPVSAIESHGERHRVRSAVGDIEADAVVLAIPAFAAAPLVAAHSTGTAAALAGLRYASVTLVSLAVDTATLERPLDASGFLVPRSAGLVLTACSWASTKWAHLATDGTALLRASIGRVDDERHLAMDDAEVVDAVMADLATTMGLRSAPTASRVTRWPASLPQYPPGHEAVVDLVTAELADRAPGVHLTGAACRGLGLPACVRQGRETAVEVARDLGLTAIAAS
ncbi:MAG: protoporphyrinogen oxidase [Actinomycetota bacterium]|nr:protoporphyrinogen oxidase [Actinomycetota bacterium]